MNDSSGRVAAAFAIGPFRIEPTRNAVLLGEQETSLEPRVMDVLCQLAAAAGEVVSRDQLIEQVWGVEYGADESLTGLYEAMHIIQHRAADFFSIKTTKQGGILNAKKVAAMVQLRNV